MGAALLSLVACCLLLFTAADKHSKESRRRYCGDELTNTLSFVCDGIFKRTDKLPHNDLEYEDSTNSGSSGNDDLFRALEDGLGLSGHRFHLFRDKRQVATECCHQPCSLSQMEAYCGPKES